MLAVCVFAHSLIVLFLDDFLCDCVGLFLGIVFFAHIVPKYFSVKAVNVKIFFNHVFPMHDTRRMNLIKIGGKAKKHSKKHGKV